MSATSETLAIFLGLDTLAWPALIAGRRVITPGRPRKSASASQTAGALERVTSPAPAPAINQPGQLTAVPDQPAATTVVSDEAERRLKRLPKLRPLDECKQPHLAQYARGRQRNEHGQFVPTGRAS